MFIDKLCSLMIFYCDLIDFINTGLTIRKTSCELPYLNREKPLQKSIVLYTNHLEWNK